jgi:hypothetical protein
MHAATAHGGTLPRRRAAFGSGGRAHPPTERLTSGHQPNVPPFPVVAGACLHIRWRHAPRVTWPACHHGTFGICIERWSFLAFHWGRCSDLSKFSSSLNKDKSWLLLCPIELWFNHNSTKKEVNSTRWVVGALVWVATRVKGFVSSGTGGSTDGSVALSKGWAWLGLLEVGPNMLMAY